MHILYLDDSGSTQNQNNKYFVLGGVSIYETQARIVNDRLENLARKICPENSAAAEFHASEIFGRRKPPWKGMEKRQSIEVIEVGFARFWPEASMRMFLLAPSRKNRCLKTKIRSKSLSRICAVDSTNISIAWANKACWCWIKAPKKPLCKR